MKNKNVMPLWLVLSEKFLHNEVFECCKEENILVKNDVMSFKAEKIKN